MSAEPKELKDIVSDHQLFCARFSPCGETLFAGSMDGGVRRWKVVDKTSAAPAENTPPPAAELSGEPVKKTATPQKQTAAKPVSAWEFQPLPPFDGFEGWVQTIALHPSQTKIYAADSWGKLAAADYSKEQVKRVWETPGAHDGWIRRLAVSGDGALLATCGFDGFVKVWNGEDGKQISAFDAGSDVFSVTFTPDGSQLVFGDMFGKIALLDFKAAKVVRSFDGAVLYKLDRLQDIAGLRALAFSKDGKTLVAAGILPKSGGTVQGTPLLLYFDYASGKLEQQFTHGEPKDGYIEDLAVRSGGEVLAVTSGTPGSGLFFLHTLGEKAPSYVSNKLANCLSVALHPEGQRFVVTSTNKASNGNGRRLSKDGEYLGNSSPVHLFEIPT